MKRNDLVSGPVFKTLLLFSLPLVATNVVQLLFHAADVAVLGIMVDDGAVAAVGACGPIVNLLVSLFAGLASGSNVLIARLVGSRDTNGARRATGTSLIIGLLSGVFMTVVAIVGARQFLIWMQCQPDVLEEATLYLRIYASGMPIIMLYNFVSAILRGVGDSTRPMVYMFVAGGLNVALNFFFIGACGMEVAGVALATVLSNLVSLVLALVALFKNNGFCKVEMCNLRIRKWELTQIVKVGVPSAVCGLFFYVSNLFVSAGVNSLSTDAMTANAVSGQFDGIIYNVGMSIAIACMAMVGQGIGAHNISRVKKTVLISIGYATVASLALGGLFVLLAEPLLGIMTDSQAVIEIAKEKMVILCLTYFVTSIMEVFSFSLRAMGYNGCTFVVGVLCGFFIRSAWVWFVWEPLGKGLGTLYYAYPVSAGSAVLIYTVYYCFFAFKGVRKRLGEEKDVCG